MRTDADLEGWLRRELLAHETQIAPDGDLAEKSATRARRVRQRRAWLTGTTAAAAVLVLVVAVTALNEPHRKSVSPAPASQKPSTTAPPVTQLAGPWAASLPVGEPPEVAYLAKTDLYLPSGKVVPLGDGGDIIGETVAGTVVLVMETTGNNFNSWYALVTPEGIVSRIASGRITPVRAQEAVVSPDGRYFSDGRIFDMTTGQIVGAIPVEADIQIAWTTHGILYGAGRSAYLWSPDGSEPIKLGTWPGGYYHGTTDVGLGQRDGCLTVTRLHADGSQEELSRLCQVPLAPDGANATVSPGGTWLVSPELVAVDVATGEEHPLAGRPVANLNYAYDAHWLSEDEVLLSIPGGGYQSGVEPSPSDSALIIRCDLATSDCERATDAYAGLGVGPTLRMP